MKLTCTRFSQHNSWHDSTQVVSQYHNPPNISMQVQCQAQQQGWLCQHPKQCENGASGPNSESVDPGWFQGQTMWILGLIAQDLMLQTSMHLAYESSASVL